MLISRLSFFLLLSIFTSLLKAPAKKDGQSEPRKPVEDPIIDIDIQRFMLVRHEMVLLVHSNRL